MSFKIIFLFGLLVLFLMIVGCGVQPGKTIVGEAVSVGGSGKEYTISSSASELPSQTIMVSPDSQNKDGRAQILVEKKIAAPYYLCKSWNMDTYMGANLNAKSAYGTTYLMATRIPICEKAYYWKINAADFTTASIQLVQTGEYLCATKGDDSVVTLKHSCKSPWKGWDLSEPGHIKLSSDSSMYLCTGKITPKEKKESTSSQFIPSPIPPNPLDLIKSASKSVIPSNEGSLIVGLCTKGVQPQGDINTLSFEDIYNFHIVTSEGVNLWQADTFNEAVEASGVTGMSCAGQENEKYSESLFQTHVCKKYISDGFNRLLWTPIVATTQEEAHIFSDVITGEKCSLENKINFVGKFPTHICAGGKWQSLESFQVQINPADDLVTIKNECVEEWNFAKGENVFSGPYSGCDPQSLNNGKYWCPIKAVYVVGDMYGTGWAQCAGYNSNGEECVKGPWYYSDGKTHSGPYYGCNDIGNKMGLWCPTQISYVQGDKLGTTRKECELKTCPSGVTCEGKKVEGKVGDKSVCGADSQEWTCTNSGWKQTSVTNCQCPTEKFLCDDEVDNDKDGTIDCADTDCTRNKKCKSVNRVSAR